MMAETEEKVAPPKFEPPIYTVASAAAQKEAPSKKGGITRKHVLLAVSGVLVVVLIVVAVIVSISLYTQTQKEIVQFSLKFKGSDDNDINQDVESDPNDNVVMFHVTKPGQDAYVVNDFNKGMQIVKLKSEDGVSCYITALNKSSAMDPKAITGPDSMQDKDGSDESTFAISEDPVVDRSFMTKKARDLCKDVTVYWVTKTCGEPMQDQNGTNPEDHERAKRKIYKVRSYHGLPGLAGCCRAHWACRVRIVEYVYGSRHVCYTYTQTGTCCGRVKRPYCHRYYKGHHNTPGLNC